jgi:hypothetical protein
VCVSDANGTEYVMLRRLLNERVHLLSLSRVCGRHSPAGDDNALSTSAVTDVSRQHSCSWSREKRNSRFSSFV